MDFWEEIITEGTGRPPLQWTDFKSPVSRSIPFQIPAMNGSIAEVQL